MAGLVQPSSESKLPLEIRTKSVEQTLVPLVTQVSLKLYSDRIFKNQITIPCCNKILKYVGKIKHTRTNIDSVELSYPPHLHARVCCEV